MQRKLGWILLLSLSWTLTVGTARSQTDPGSVARAKIGWSLREDLKSAGNEVPILVILKDQADLGGAIALRNREDKGRYVYQALRDVALRTQGGLEVFLNSRGLAHQGFYLMNAVAIERATPGLIQELSTRDDVAKIIKNPRIAQDKPIFVPSGPGLLRSSAVGDNLVSVNAQKVWTDLGVRGQGIVVAGQDTGVEWRHPALIRHYRGTHADGTADHAYNWHDSIHHTLGSGTNPCGLDSREPCDDDQHGTHTMGTMVGSEGAENQIGMAPAAQWIACRNMDRGVGAPSTYLECFEFFLAPYPQGTAPTSAGDPSKAPNVINNSWGCPAEEGCQGQEFLPALQALKAAGILVVASAGNDGPDCSTLQNAPAHHSAVTLSVGAVDHRANNEIASFSSRGPSKLDGGIGPDVSAPGVSIRSSVPGGKYEQALWSGTSMAGPHVAGEVALLWSAQPGLIGKVDETTALIQRTSLAKTSTENCGGAPGSRIPNNTYGWGVIDAFRAVTQALHP